jgi:hypothetical protein
MLITGRFAPYPTVIDDLSASAESDTEVRLVFTEHDSSSLVTYQYRLDGGSPTTLAGSKIISGLTAATEYDFEVRGVRTATLLGDWSNVATVTTDASADVPVVANQTLVFGRLTRAGAGGTTAVTTGGAITGGTIDSGTNANHWQISGGVITPSATGVAAGLSASYTLGCTFSNSHGSDTATITINTEANTYSVGLGELAAVINLGSATIDGKTIKGRPDADLCGAAPGDLVTFPSASTYTTGITITSHDTADQCFMRRLQLRNNGIINFSYVTIRDSFVFATDNNDNSNLIVYVAPGAPQVTFDNCTFYADDAETEQHVHSSGAGAVAGTPSGGQTVVDLSAATPSVPDLSDVKVHASSTTNAWLRMNASQSQRYIIRSVDNTAKTITVAGSVTTGAGNWEIGNVTNLKIISMSGSTPTSKLVATDCTFRDYTRAITGGYGHFHVEGCTFDRAISDHISVGPSGTETHFEILNNRFLKTFGKALDPQNPHCDAVQLNCIGMTQANTVPYEIIGNIIFTKGGRSHQVGGIFIENPAVANYEILAKIEHNLIMTTARNGITLELGASGSTIRGNTVVYDNSANESGDLTPYIQTVTGDEPVDNAGCLIEYNAVCNIEELNAADTNNYEFGTTTGANDNTDYAAVFAGTSFGSDDLADLAAFMTAFTPDAGGALGTPSPKIGALNGYYDYDTGVSTAPWD